MRNEKITNVTVNCPTCDKGKVRATVTEILRKGFPRLSPKVEWKTCKCKWGQPEWAKAKMDSLDEWASQI